VDYLSNNGVQMENSETVTEVRGLLSLPLNNDNPVVLREQMTQAEAYQALVSLMRREAIRELSRQKGLHFDPTLSSEDKRKIALEHDVREYQFTADSLSDLAGIIMTRISLGQSLLSSYRAEVSSGIR
jgi:hypothetical protein